MLNELTNESGRHCSNTSIFLFLSKIIPLELGVGEILAQGIWTPPGWMLEIAHIGLWELVMHTLLNSALMKSCW